MTVTTIEGFPELTPTAQCRLCQLANTRPGFLRVIHDYRRVEGLGPTIIANRIRQSCIDQGLKPLTKRSVGRHFDTHVDFSAFPSDEVVDAHVMPVPADIVRSELEMLTASVEDMALGRNDSDYHQMVDLFRRLMRRIAALDADPKAFITDDGQHHALQRLTAWKGLIDSAARILSDLNKMRNQDKMTVSILEAHTKKFAMAIAAPIGSELRTVRDDLLGMHEPQAHHLATRINMLLEGGVTDIFSQAATVSLRQSKEQFKLLN